ncbi:MAG: D-aminoacyl-tRNA deacylase [Bacteroidetes bacterium]|nr:D-aminoacyl-tRNA deacylase [Bacteroidota bacterium]
MRAVIQRVFGASVTIDAKVTSTIGNGLLILVGIEAADTEEDIVWLSQKICNMRLFDDLEGVMNLSAVDVGAELLLISQFTLYASTRKGNRPSYIGAARPEIAMPLYEKLISRLSLDLGRSIATGTFGADMRVSLVNHGPVTIIIDTKSKS